MKLGNVHPDGSGRKSMLRHSGVVKRGYREILDIDYKYDIPYQKKAPNCINGKFMLPERATRDEDSALSGA